MGIPNVRPQLFSGSAVVVGYLLIDDMTANEQNALGNWLMLTAQVLSTNAFYQQVQQERGNINNTRGLNFNKKNNFTTSNNNENNNDDSKQNSEIAMLKKMVSALQQEINNLEKRI